MPNFDALRTSTLGALSYLCKPKPPAELLGCFPLMTGSDKSRYGGEALAPASAVGITTKSDGTTALPYEAIKIDSGTSVSYYLGKSLDMSQDWTFEYFDVRYTGNAYCHAVSTVGNIRACTFQPSSTDGNGIFNGSTTICAMDNNFLTNFPFFHFAMVYRASTKKLICFINGSTKSAYQGSVDLSSASSTGVITQQAVNAAYAFANVRICQKALGSTTSFPVPTALYTGYEPL